MGIEQILLHYNIKWKHNYEDLIFVYPKTEVHANYYGSEQKWILTHFVSLEHEVRTYPKPNLS